MPAKQQNQAKKDGLILLVGMVLMLRASYLSSLNSRNLLLNALLIFLEPSGWFLVWYGLDDIFYSSKHDKSEFAFYKTLAKSKILFASIKGIPATGNGYDSKTPYFFECDINHRFYGGATFFFHPVQSIFEEYYLRDNVNEHKKINTMDILIDDSLRIFEIQEIFNQHFLNLKLEFFELDPTRKKTYSKANLIKDVNKSIGEIRHIHRSGHISINGHQKVRTLEKNFLQGFGINLQVFRRSGSTWLQTTSTDEWTLAEQNQRAETVSKVLAEKPLEADDYYHEQS